MKFTCINCGTGDCREVIAAANNRPPLVECLECSAEMFWPIPDSAVLSAYYSATNFFATQGKGLAETYLANPQPVRQGIARYVAELKEAGIPDGGVVVDLGCSFGPGIIELRRHGYDAVGIEPSVEAMAWLNANGGRGHCGDLFDAPLTRIDALLSSHALEHMPDPYAALRRIHELMPIGGRLTIGVPNWGGLLARHQRATWKWFSYPYHLHYFRPNVLARTLRTMGFEVLRIDSPSYPHEVTEIAEAFNMQNHTPQPILDMLRNGLAESFIVTARRVPKAKPAAQLNDRGHKFLEQDTAAGTLQ